MKKQEKDILDTTLQDGLEKQAKALVNINSRNPLINLPKRSAKAITIIDELPNVIVRRLREGKSFTFLPIEKAPAFEPEIGFNLPIELPIQPKFDDETSPHHIDNKLQTNSDSIKLERLLKNIHAHARSELTERGFSTLFLAIGFLQYHKSGDVTAEQIAPLFLIPVTIAKVREKSGVHYKLKILDSEAKTNQSLGMLLERDFGVLLPHIGDEEPEPEDYLDHVKRVVQDSNEQWTVLRQARIGFFNFTGIAIQEDLKPANWEGEEGESVLLNHPSIRLAVLGEDEEFENQSDPPELYTIDDHQRGSKIVTPLESDSSQTSALIDILDDKNIIIEGPPGTGKSQTITNLISLALQEGKRILFVAEKPAALDVVHTKLCDIGLKDYLLYHRPGTSSNVDIYEQLRKRINKSKPNSDQNELDEKHIELRREQDLIAKYLDAIHAPVGRLGKNIYEMVWELSHVLNKGAVLLSFNEVAFALTEDLHYQRQSLFDAIENALTETDYESVAAWAEIDASKYNNTDRIHIEDAGTQIFNARDAIRSIVAEFKNTTGISNLDLSNIDPKLSHSIQITVSSDLFASDIDEAQLALWLNTDSSVSSVDLKHIRSELEQSPVSVTDLNASTADHFVQEASWISNLHDQPNVTLSNLVRGVSQLNVAWSQVSDQQPALEALGHDPSGTIADTVAFTDAIQCFENLIRSGFKSISIGDLSPINHSKWTSEIQEAQDLHQERKELSDIFSFEILPDQDSAVQIATEACLLRHSPLRFLRPSWYRLRRTIARFVNPKYPLKNALKANSLLRLREHLLSWNRWHDESNFHKSKPDLPESAITNGDALRAVKSLKKLHELQIAGYLDPVSLFRKYSSQPAPPTFEQLRSPINQLAKIYLAPTPASLHGNGSKEDLLRCLWSAIYESILKIERLSHAIKILIEETSWIAEQPLHEAWNSCKLAIGLHALRVQIEQLEFEWPSNDLSNWLHRLENAKILSEKIEDLGEMPVELQTALLCENPIQLLLKISSTLKEIDSKNNAAMTAYKNTIERLGTSINNQPNCPTLEDAIAFADLVKQKIGVLPAWSSLCRHREKSIVLDIQDWVDPVLSGTRSAQQAKYDYLASSLNIELGEALKNNEHLHTVSGDQLNVARSRFNQIDKELRLLSHQSIAASVHRHPSQITPGQKAAKVGDLSEMRLIEHEVKKQKRHLRIRPLLHRAENAAFELKPCVFMNPTTVAETLPRRSDLFDLVIFDEASQIKPGDAYGSLARAKRFVIVGDPKQLPPSNFFASTFEPDTDSVEDENEQLVSADSESILEVLQRTMPRNRYRRLTWHYRSQHESLIAFSNSSFYDNELVVFPASSNSQGQLGVFYEYIENGSFEGGRNIEEAKIVAEAIVKHAHDHRGNDQIPSLGVAAMNRAQTDLIAELLDKLCISDPDARRVVSQMEERTEGLFIKNLENVQGDERDIMFISYTYGKDPQSGKVPQRFGPINFKGGWRRLNVLITRARKQVRVFSSLHQENIVGGPKSSRGVNAMKDYLAYAETGSIPDRGEVTDREPDSAFEESVMNSLQAMGVEVVPQVGVAGYFIDIGIRLEGSNDFILGIECDGATYHSAKSARDRDSIRQDVIESKGWEIYRIWSTDWFHNREHAVEKLRQVVQDAADRYTARERYSVKLSDRDQEDDPQS